MTESGPGVIAAVRQLSEALEGASLALTAADLTGLLESERRLELAVGDIPVCTDLPSEARRALRLELARARSLLRRCRRSGDVLLDIVQLTFETQGRIPGYGPKDHPALLHAPRLMARA